MTALHDGLDMLDRWRWWIVLGLAVWLIVGLAVGILVGRFLARRPDDTVVVHAVGGDYELPGEMAPAFLARLRQAEADAAASHATTRRIT